ncbi:hypothetical protein HDU81_004948 [Chytriomyces hyalinus]|nr:hypothetical protein HDU81_004948 [Chytriomyces hyalinus]
MSDLEILHALLSPDLPKDTSPAPANSDSIPLSLQYPFSNFRDAPLASPALDMQTVVGYPSPFLQHPPASNLMHSPYINEMLNPLDPFLLHNMSGMAVQPPLQTPPYQAHEFKIAHHALNSFFPAQDADLNLNLVHESDGKSGNAVATMFQSYACLMPDGGDYLNPSEPNDFTFTKLMNLATPVQAASYIPYSDFIPEITPTRGVTPPSNIHHHTTTNSIKHSPTSSAIPKSESLKEQHQCPYTTTCSGVVFSSLEKLKTHTQKVHSNELKNLIASVTQPSAVSYTTSEQEFNSGIPRPYKCTYPGCTRAFSQPSNLRSHIVTHTGERRHKCQVEGCFNSYTTSNRLKVHMRDHRYFIFVGHICHIQTTSLITFPSIQWRETICLRRTRLWVRSQANVFPHSAQIETSQFRQETARIHKASANAAV